MNRYINYIALLILAILSTGCDKGSDDPEPTPTELQLIALQNGGKPWVITSESGSVKKDGYDVTNQFDGFTLSFGEFTFTTQNGGNAWPGSGMWEFSNNDPNKLVRNDGVLMAANLTNNSLVLTFTITNIGGRVGSIEGEFIFVLTSG